MIETGTRTRQLPVNTRMPEGSETRLHTCDVQMAKNVTGSFTFTANSQKIAGAFGNFLSFAINDVILVQGTSLNNGLFTVIGIAAVVGTFLVIDPPPKTEGPVTATVRTA